MKKKNLAFTLAEVLIVIGIIGVVAALTLPNLNHATGDKEKVTRVKKIYSALTDAVDRAQVIYGDFDTWFNDLSDDDSSARSERFAKRVTEFMKVSKDCGTDQGCWTEADLTDARGVSYGEPGHRGYSVLLPDNTAISFAMNDIYFARIMVDIDGPRKGKYQEGNDIFEFDICYNDENCHSGTTLNELSTCQQTNTEYNNSALIKAYTTQWVVENGNLDYLKCFDKLDWETKTSCE